MNQLTGKLHIYCLTNVCSTEEAAEARLVDKQYLKELFLHWIPGGNCSQNRSHTGVMEGLHPPSSIERLEFEKFMGDNFPPSWLTQENLPALRSLDILRCEHLKTFVVETRMPDKVEDPITCADSAQGGSTDTMQGASVNSISIGCCPFTSLTFLCLQYCNSLANLDQFLSPEYLPFIQSMHIIYCRSLVSLPVHNFGGFVCLQNLWIHGCESLVCPRDMVLPPSLQRLYISMAGEVDKSISHCLEHLSSLNLLYLDWCAHLECILLNSINTSNLKCLVLRECRKLSSIGGSHALSPIKHVEISMCPLLTVVEQPFLKQGLSCSERKELIYIDNQREFYRGIRY